MRRAPLFALAPLLLVLAGCAGFAHGIVEEKEAIKAELAIVEEKAEAAYGTAMGAPLSLALSGTRFALTVVLAGLGGVAHSPTDLGELVGLGACALCAEERPASRPAIHPPVLPVPQP